jgi:hypothetical protein
VLKAAAIVLGDAGADCTLISELVSDASKDFDLPFGVLDMLFYLLLCTEYNTVA